jgi:hypothetical protein
MWIFAALLLAGTGLGPGAKAVPAGAGATLWWEPLPGGGQAIALINRGVRPVQIDVIFHRLGMASRLRVMDVTQGNDWGTVHGGFAQRVDPGAARWFRLQPLAR